MWKTEEDLSMIVAVDEAGGISKDGQIPWSYGEDWKHFKAETKGAICIMGRGTYEDIAERRSKRSPLFRTLLLGRECYVVSSKLAGTIPQGTKGAFSSTRQILDHVAVPKDSDQEIYILGGSRLYLQHLVNAKQIWMTIVPGYRDCDKYFPVEHVDDTFTILEGRETDSKLKFVRYVKEIDYLEVTMRNEFIDEMLKHISDRVVKRFKNRMAVGVTHLHRHEVEFIRHIGGFVKVKKGYATGEAMQ